VAERVLSALVAVALLYVVAAATGAARVKGAPLALALLLLLAVTAAAAFSIASTGRGRRIVVLLAVQLLVLGVAEARVFVRPPSDIVARVDAVVVLGGPTYLERLHTAEAYLYARPGAALVVSIAGTTPCPKSDATDQVVCFVPDPGTTRGEARGAAKLATEHHWRRLAVVTSADQASRARVRFGRCFDGSLALVVAPTDLGDVLGRLVYENVATLKAMTVQRSC
jgi:uncharacterized SAM-binding protein YcdF (DUF218 family)